MKKGGMKQKLHRKKETGGGVPTRKKKKEVGMKIGRSAVAALIQPPSLFLPASVVV